MVTHPDINPVQLNFGEQTGTGVFPLVIAVPHVKGSLKADDQPGTFQGTHAACQTCPFILDQFRSLIVSRVPPIMLFILQEAI